MKSLLIIICNIILVSATPTPIVLWHGMGDTCCAGYSLGGFKEFLQKNIPGVYVKSIMIGNSTVEDFESGYFVHPNVQVAEVCKMIADDNNLRDGFHAIGFSQGSQFLRAVAQRCGNQLTMRNLVSLGGQHQGVYGLPHCGALTSKPCDYVRMLLNYAAYNSWVQQELVQATYWHDPIAEDKYKAKSTFLSDINNEVHINRTYVNNLGKLEYFILVKFNGDSIVQPRETEWFGFYKPGQSKELMTLQESKLYLQDRLGLRKMNDEGRLIFLSTPGDHLQFEEQWFIGNIIKPYLST